MPQPIEIPLGWSRPKRKHFLTELAKNPQVKYSHQLRFQGKPVTFPVHPVQIDLPKYRLANGRTQAAQEEYLAKNPKLGNDFFARDPESDQAQAVQHKLLWDMVINTKLLKVFEDPTNSQEEPLILTYDGFVLNGNRRLCAMRELYYGDPERYSSYSHVDVVVLPFCDAKDLDELEAYLQIRPETKEDYTWIAMACMLRARQKAYGYTNQQLSALYDLPDKEIQSRLAQLDLVDEYLESRGKAKQYNLVENADYAFRQLHKGRQQLKQPDERDFFTGVSYCLIDDSDAAEGRLYQRIPEVKENLPEIAARLSQELKVETSSAKPRHDYSVFGTGDTEGNLEPLAKAVAESRNRVAIIENVIDIIDAQKEKEKQRTKANAVLKQIVDANTRLKNAINSFAKDTSTQGIEEQLQAIEQSIRTIRKWLT